MRDRVSILSGLALFLLLFTYPVWHGVANHTSTQGPLVELPANRQTCVAGVEFMRTSHMQLLISWRDGFVREHRRRYAGANGASYKVSLTNTCLDQCHGSRKEFCDRCHSYVAVPTPNCWSCHQDASQAASAATASATTPERLP